MCWPRRGLSLRSPGPQQARRWRLPRRPPSSPGARRPGRARPSWWARWPARSWRARPSAAPRPSRTSSHRRAPPQPAAAVRCSTSSTASAATTRRCWGRPRTPLAGWRPWTPGRRSTRTPSPTRGTTPTPHTGCRARHWTSSWWPRTAARYPGASGLRQVSTDSGSTGTRVYAASGDEPRYHTPAPGFATDVVARDPAVRRGPPPDPVRTRLARARRYVARRLRLVPDRLGASRSVVVARFGVRRPEPAGPARARPQPGGLARRRAAPGPGPVPLASGGGRRRAWVLGPDPGGGLQRHDPGPRRPGGGPVVLPRPEPAGPGDQRRRLSVGAGRSPSCGAFPTTPSRGAARISTARRTTSPPRASSRSCST